MTFFSMPYISPAKLVSAIRRQRFGLAAFLIPLAIRAIPEILVGPYPVGWDTIASYVPNTLDWAAGKMGWVSLLGTAPLLYIISVPVYLVTRVNPVWIFKIMGPLLYGSMILALYRFLRLGLRWTERMSLGAGLMTSLYFVTLRISWDLYRNMLGTIFILVGLPLLNSHSKKGLLVLSALTGLAVLSDQLTGVVALALVGLKTLETLAKRNGSDSFKLGLVLAPGLGLFLSIVYAFSVTSNQNIVVVQPASPTIQQLVSSVGFLSYAYLPIAAFAILGARRVTNSVLRIWCLTCLGFLLTALLPFLGFIGSYEWSILLSLPVCTYAAEGLAGLSGKTWTGASLTRFASTNFMRFFSIALVVSALLYIALPAENAMPYFGIFSSTMPTSMTQDTMPLSEMQALSSMLTWVQTHMDPNSALITNSATYGWARAYLSPVQPVVNFQFSSPLVGVRMAKEEGYTSFFMIWWANGTGWDGQPYVPAGFVPVQQSGLMVVYTYG
jgi:hypothetical protein